MISKLVREKAEPFIQSLSAIILCQSTALNRILRDGIGDPVVKTAVESPKFVYVDLRGTFKC